MDGINDYIKKWKVNGWKTASKKPVKNSDLWKQLDELSVQHSIRWNWVKGHADIEKTILLMNWQTWE